MTNRPATSASLPRQWNNLCKVCAVASVFALGAGVLHAAQTSENFDVNITLAPGQCAASNTQGGSGAGLAVVCGTGAADSLTVSRATPPAAPRNDGYRLMNQRDEAIGNVDRYSGAITTTAVRVVNLAGRQYIEMTVGW